MKAQGRLAAAQQQMRARAQNPRRVGRPRLNIDEDTIISLLGRGYTPKGIAMHLGRSLRTLGRRFPYLVPGSFKDPVIQAKALLYQQALAGDIKALTIYAKAAGMKVRMKR